jgi:hypothetical protein
MSGEGEGNARLRGSVAAILSSTALVLNRGSDDGVLVGMRFAILNRQGANIKDPETGEILGSVEVPKAVVKVVRVDGPHLSVARTFRRIPGTTGAAHSLLALGNLFQVVPDKTETLEITEDSILDMEADPNALVVRVGDPVVEAKGEEYDD